LISIADIGETIKLVGFDGLSNTTLSDHGFCATIIETIAAVHPGVVSTTVLVESIESMV